MQISKAMKEIYTTPISEIKTLAAERVIAASGNLPGFENGEFTL